MLDWNLLAEEAIKEGFRNAPAIIIAGATGVGIILSNWRQNVKTRKIVADGFKDTALAMGKLQGFQEAIPLSRQDRDSQLATAKEIVQMARDIAAHPDAKILPLDDKSGKKD